MNLCNVPLWHMRKVWATDAFQKWWHRSWCDPTSGSFSNIRTGDIFSLGETGKLGMVTRKKVTYSESKGWFMYELSDDRGYRYLDMGHDSVVKSEFLFIPNATQLAELATELDDTTLEGWAKNLIEFYRNHPFRQNLEVR